MVSAPGGGIEVEVSTSGVRRAKNALDSLARGAAKARAAMIGMSGGFRRVGRTAPRATSRVRGFARSLRSIGTEKAFSLRTIAAAIGTLGTAAVGAATPLAGLGLAAGGIGAALLGGVKAAKNTEDRLETLKKSAQEAIRPLRAFSDLSFGVLQGGVSLLGDLATMLASLETPITSVVNKWGQAFSGEKISIITELKKTILQFLGPIRDLGLYIINNLAPALETLRTAGVNALPAVRSLLSGITSSIGPFVEFSTKVLSAVVPALNRLGGIVLTVVGRIRSFYEGLRSTGALTELSALLTRVAGILGRFAGRMGSARSVGVLFGTMLSTVVGYAQRFVSFLQRAKLAVDTFVAGFAATGAIRSFKTLIKDIVTTLTGLAPKADLTASALQGLYNAGMTAGQAFNGVVLAARQLWSAIKPLIPVLKAQLATAFGAVKKMVAQVRPSLDKLRQLWEKNKSTIIPFFKAILSLLGPLGKLATAIGTVLIPVLTGFAQGVWKIVRPLIEMLTPAIRALGPIITTVANKIQTWASRNQELLRKLGMVAGAVAALFAPFGTLFGWVGRLIGVVGRFFPKLTKLISFFGRVGKSTSRLVSRFVQFGSRVTKTIAKTFSRVVSRVSSGMSNARSLIQSGWAAARSIVSSATSTIRSTVSGAFGKVRSAVSGSMGTVRSIIQRGWNKAKSIVSGATSTIRSTVSGAFSKVRSTISGAMRKARNLIGRVWNRIKSLTSRALGRMKSAVDNVMGKIKDAVKSGFNGVKNRVTNGIDAAVRIVANASDRFKSAGKDLIAELAKGIKNAASKATDAVGSVVSDVKGFLPGSDADRGPLSDLSSAGPAIPKMLADGMQRYRRRVKKAAETVAAAANVRAAGSFRGRTRTSRAGSGPSGTVSRAVAGSVAASARRRPVAGGGGGTTNETHITVDATIAASSRAEGAAAGDALLERLNALTPTK